MKPAIVIFILNLVAVTAFSQKVKVEVIKNEAAAVSEWQILNDKFMPVFSGDEYFRSDSVSLTLDANKRYFLSLSVTGISDINAVIYTLILNGEPLILVKTDLGTGDHFFPFFTGVRNSDTKITGGTNAAISDFPWQVYLIAGDSYCGGTIIANNWILTAAHCTTNSLGNPIPAASMSIKAGADNPRNVLEGQTYKVSQVIVHNNYNSQSQEYDIALLKLQQPINYPNALPVKFITAEDVAYGATDPGVMSWVTGYGAYRINPTAMPPNLLKVQLPIITKEQASTVWPSIPFTSMMAGYKTGNRDACFGDSGGPLVVPVVDEYKVAGIVSWGSTSCNSYGGYTRVSLFENWIREKTGIVKEYRPPAPGGDSIVCQGEVSGQYSVNIIPGATNYEWRITPSDAGTVSSGSASATVTWNTAYTGSVTLLMRVVINNVVSEWSKLDLKVVLNTRLLDQSGDTVICAKQPVTLYVKAEGYNLTYRWSRDGIVVQTGTSSQLIISSATVQNSGSYICMISGHCGTVYSAAIQLTVHPLTKISSVSPDIAVPFGDNVALEVSAEGHNLSYQWQKDGVPFENSNSPVFSLLNLNASDIGLYRTTVSGTCGTELSKSVYVYVRRSANSGLPEVFLWPSVTSDEFNVALSNDDTYTVSVFNMGGQLVNELTNCRYQVTINISTKAKGTYIVRVFNRTVNRSLKIIKE